MNTSQGGICAFGTASHAYLEFDVLGAQNRPAQVAAIASLREPRTTMGRVLEDRLMRYVEDYIVRAA